MGNPLLSFLICLRPSSQWRIETEVFAICFIACFGQSVPNGFRRGNTAVSFVTSKTQKTKTRANTTTNHTYATTSLKRP